MNNDGKQHRKLIKKRSIYEWLRQNKYPNGFQILCFNCNCGKSINKGKCPHELITKHGLSKETKKLLAEQQDEFSRTLNSGRKLYQLGLKDGLAKNREETTSKCLEAVKSFIKDRCIPRKEVERLYKQGFGAGAKECEEHNSSILEIYDFITALSAKEDIKEYGK